MEVMSGGLSQSTYSQMSQSIELSQTDEMTTKSGQVELGIWESGGHPMEFLTQMNFDVPTLFASSLPPPLNGFR
jgi:hypothetical protein